MNRGLFDNGYIRTATVVPEVFIGDIGKNCVEIIEYTKKAMDKNIDLLVFPELSLTGYTSQDLFLNSDYIKKTIGGIKFIQEKLSEYSADKRDILIAVGAPVRKDNQLFNCAVWISAKKGILGVVPKTHIPNYGEFYEKRWFSSATQKINSVINLFGNEYPFTENFLIKLSNNNDREVVIGTEICEDLWVAVPPSSYHVLNGANIIVNLSASNETVGKSGYRTELVKQQAARGICGYVYVSAGSSESTSDTVFSGHSIISENGEVVVNSRVENEILYADLDVEKLIHERTRVNSFMENRSYAEYKTVELYWENRTSIFELKRNIKQNPFLHNDETMKEIINIQAKGLETRLKKTGIKNVVLGISGGLDSTLALLVCRRAFENLGLDLKGIHGITMPCFGTTNRTYNNSLNLMKNLGISYKDINIKKSVTQHFEDIGHSEDVYDVTYENCQARERTQVLMDYSNKVNGLVIGTGDLSEIFLGWMTYNGDHMSMYAVNSGVPKTIVKRLVEIIKSEFDKDTEEVLTDILNTEISPELLPPGKNGEILQSTEKTIGNYLLHDFFIFHFFRNGFGIEKMFYLAEIAFKGVFSTENIVNTLEIFTKRVFRNQFKRNCLPDGVKIGSIAVSPRADLRLASEIEISMWMNDVEKVKRYAKGDKISSEEKYKSPNLAIDLCLFTICDKEEKNPKKVPEKVLKVLILKRGKEPYKDMYSLAGCAAKSGEKTDITLKRKIKEKSGIDIEKIYMEIGGVFDDPQRDLRNHVVSITYMGLCNHSDVEIGEGAEWIDVKDVIDNFKDKMAFDHYEIVCRMYENLKEKVWKESIIFYTLPELFTLYQLQLSYGAVAFTSNTGTDQNFRRKIGAKEWIEKTEIKEESVFSRNKAFYYRKQKLK